MTTEVVPLSIAPSGQMGADVAATDYLQTRGYLYADRFTVGRSDAATFGSETDLWKAALGGHGFFETRRLTLEDVVLTDWLPLAPGRYHTPKAKSAREDAEQRIVERHRDHVIYDAHGKTSMVQGGVGCLRLTVKNVGGEQVKFLSATSSGVVHRGFVVALGLAQYESIAEIIDRQGGVRCTIVGTVRYWKPDEELRLRTVVGVPRVFLGVDELRQGRPSADALPPLVVTPAVTFEANGVEYFTYSRFKLGDPGRVDQAAEWMDRYVSERYSGRVMTDFDEQVARFADTALPLKTLMDPDVQIERIAVAFAHYVSEQSLTVITNNIGEVQVGDRYEISGQVGAVGPGAQAKDMTFVQHQAPEIDVEALAEELGRLRVALKERGTEAEQDLAVGEVAAAEVAAKQGDTAGALLHLKQAGKWALEVAREIGVPVATQALKSVVG